jgi:hypothetical protein
MSTIATALANSAECMCCAANSISIVKLKKINAICIGCLSLVAIGSATFSTYLMYKIWKYQKKLAYLEKKIESLKFNITEDNTDEVAQEQLSDILEEDESEDDDILKTNDADDDTNVEEPSSSLEEEEDDGDDDSSTTSDYDTVEKSKRNAKSNILQIKNTNARLSVSPQIESSDDIAFETPVGSPDQRALQFLNKIEMKIESESNEESNMQLDDNKCMDLIKCESYEEVLKINQKRKEMYETVSLMSNQELELYSSHFKSRLKNFYLNTKGS